MAFYEPINESPLIRSRQIPHTILGVLGYEPAGANELLRKIKLAAPKIHSRCVQYHNIH